MDSDIQRIIDHLQLAPHPEGGFYRETYRSVETLAASALDARYGGERSAGTGIYFLLTEGNFSAFHRLRSDELYHFYAGDPVTTVQIRPDGTRVDTVLGPDLLNGHVPQLVIPRDVWQGTRLRDGGRWALLGTTVAPGFDFADFEMADRPALLARFPQHAEIIEQLTR